jgi:glutathione peroxidase
MAVVTPRTPQIAAVPMNRALAVMDYLNLLRPSYPTAGLGPHGPRSFAFFSVQNDDVSLYQIPLKTIDGFETSLEPYRGHVLLIVNVASQCGFTPQYSGLEQLYRRYREKGFDVLGFPCNQFGRQEPGTESEIQRFCSAEYDVSFPLFAKIDVNGATAHPLFEYLKAARPGFLGRTSILWNFTKFLVNREGEVVRRFGSRQTPAAIEKSVSALI